jgi:glycosyltransferase involved in cell wall biosynthesis
MYRVAINRTCTFGAKTGIGHYTAQLLSHVSRHAPGDMRVGPFPNATTCVIGALGQSAALKARQVLQKIGGRGLTHLLGPYRAAFWQHARALSQRAKGAVRRLLAAQLSTSNYDLYHEPNYLPFDSDVPKVVTIHDLSVFLYPQWHPAARVAAFEKGFPRMLAEASHFITDAECVRTEFIDRFSIPRDKVTCVYPGIGERFAPAPARRTARALKKLGLEPGYFLAVGAIEPRKNLHLAMQAYCDLPAAMRERHPFVLAGPWGWNWKEVREFFDAEAGRRGVRHLGYVPDGALPDLYRGAKALVFPSFYEGFGLPPLEMAACGGAVLASDIPPLRETLGRRALFVSPFDRDKWRQAMHDAIADDSRLDPFRREGPSIREQFSWTVAAAKFRDAYRGVLNDLKLPRLRAA